MPKIYEYLGFVFYFYSNEHEPIHVHVTKAEREIIFELIMANGQLSEIKTRKSRMKASLTAKEEKEALAFVKEFHKNIVEKWVNFFVYRKKIRSTKITRKIK